MDDLDSLWRYHEQVFRSFENQLGTLIESHQKAEGRLDRLESNLDRQGSNLDKLGLQIDKLQRYTQHAVELDIRAHRRERQRRRKEIQEAEERIEKRRAVDRAEWQERMERIERNLDRYLEGLQGPNGRGRRAKGR